LRDPPILDRKWQLLYLLLQKIYDEADYQFLASSGLLDDKVNRIRVMPGAGPKNWACKGDGIIEVIALLPLDCGLLNVKRKH